MELPVVLNLAVNIAATAAQIIAEEDAEDETIMLAIRLAAEEVEEVMALEDEGGLDPLEGESWTHVTVVINDYHQMPDRVFRLHFRMGRGVFEVLCQTLYDHLVEQGRLRRHRTPIQDIVLMVLWLLATPDSFRSVALRFGVNPGTLYYYYIYIIEALRELASKFISWPNQEERDQIKATFQQATDFPNVVGCIDGTHVYITAPLNDAAHYTNRHHTYSINVQAVVDCDLLVRDLHVGEVGSMHDDRVFQRSPLSQRLLRGEGLIPEEHLVGDGGYTLTNFMMIPFRDNGHLTERQRNFNKKLSQSRVRVENSFARAKGKWRRLKFLSARNQAIVVDHIIASFVLHNFTILHGESMLQEDELARPIRNNQVLGQEGGEEADENGARAVDEELFYIAKVIGTEKRAFIMNDVLEIDEDD